jgi:hypothetical protein
MSYTYVRASYKICVTEHRGRYHVFYSLVRPTQEDAARAGQEAGKAACVEYFGQ